MIKPYKLVFISIALFLLLSYRSEAYASEKFVVVTINGTTIEDFLSSEAIRDIALNGSVGLMNTRSNGKNNLYKPCVTLGSGEKSDVHFDYLEAVKADSNIKAKYESITLNSCSESNIVNLSINKITQINSRTLYNAEPGKLGSKLRLNKHMTEFIGGFWYNGSIKSPAFFIAMDKLGLSDYGEIKQVFDGEDLNKEKLMEAFYKNIDTADFIVIELGETESLFANRNLYSEESYKISKSKIIKGYDEIINDLRQYADTSNTILCLLSPFSFDIQGEGTELLSPVIIYNGGKNKGLLTSRTTRRPGLISSLDFAPYVLSYFNIKSEEFIGYPIEFVPFENSSQYLLNFNNTVTSTYVSRNSVLKGFAILIIVILFLFIFKLLKNLQNISGFINFLMRFALIAPFSMLIEGAFNINTITSKVLFIITFSILSILLIDKILKKSMDKIILITFLNMSGLIIDIISGQSLLMYSILSYNPIIGARYYGLGNEYLGVITGCTLIFSGCLLEKNKKYKTIIIMILIIIALLIGLPGLGANIGGLLIVSLSFLIFILLEYKYKLKKALIAGVIISILSLFMAVLVSMAFTGTESHLGRMIDQAQVNGLIILYNTAARKVSMAVKLIRYTIWSKVLIAFIIAAIVIFIKLQHYVNKMFNNILNLKNAWITALIASCGAILFNDSGIVTAALIIVYSFFSILLLSDF